MVVLYSVQLLLPHIILPIVFYVFLHPFLDSPVIASLMPIVSSTDQTRGGLLTCSTLQAATTSSSLHFAHHAYSITKDRFNKISSTTSPWSGLSVINSDHKSNITNAILMY